MYSNHNTNNYHETPTYRWSCLLNPFPQVVHTYRRSSLWVSLCFARALDEPNVFPHWSHFISALPPKPFGFPLPFGTTPFLLSGSSTRMGAGLSLSLFSAGEEFDLRSSELDAGDAVFLCKGLVCDFDTSIHSGERNQVMSGKHSFNLEYTRVYPIIWSNNSLNFMSSWCKIQTKKYFVRIKQISPGNNPQHILY